jgi:ArsR family transcriptional regulator
VSDPVSDDNDELLRRIKALSDPTRLRIFQMLMGGVQCNCEIAERLELSLSLISHHIRILRLAGLVDSQHDPQDERWIYYSINQVALHKLDSAMRQLLDAKRIQARQPCCGPKRFGAEDIPCESCVNIGSNASLPQP